MAEPHRPRLGVNVDHVATLRQQRGTRYPDPVFAAGQAELAGADQITVHLREDRRHVQERDVRILRDTVQTLLNLEMAATDAMVAFARLVRPDTVTLVPERREERTTEGGLDVVNDEIALHRVVQELLGDGLAVSLFVDPSRPQLDACRRTGARVVELHTGDYAEAGARGRPKELERLREAAALAQDLGLTVAAGHGLDYVNVRAVAAIPAVEELNIGHSIVSRAVLVGFDAAVRQMLEAMGPGRGDA
jgi:pyridoxine 5-phosphate synthase